MDRRIVQRGDLLGRAALGDAQLVELYLRHREAMWRTAQRGLNGTAVGGVSAEDVVQQVVLELKVRGLPADRTAPAQIEAYLLRSVRSRAIDAVRKMKRSERLPDADAFDPVDPGAVDPLTAAEQDSFMRHCDRLLGRLTPNERFAFEQRVRGQRPAKDVARELQVAPSRVSQLVKAALAKLRDGLQEGRHAS